MEFDSSSVLYLITFHLLDKLKTKLSCSVNKDGYLNPPDKREMPFNPESNQLPIHGTVHKLVAYDLASHHPSY